MKPVYDGVRRSLSELNLGLKDLVRVDAAVTKRDHVSSYREQRRRYLSGPLPTSTAVRVDNLLGRTSVIQLTPIAADPSVHGEMHAVESDAMAVYSRDAFSKGLVCGNWLFVSGATASAHSRSVKNSQGLADEAWVDENYWAQSPVKVQSGYVLLEKIRGVLKAAGHGLENIVRANIFLTDCERDLGPFWETWLDIFDGAPPATIITPIDGLGLVAARIEISVVAYKVRDDIVKVVSDTPDESLPGCPVAVRAGGLVWCSSVAGSPLQPPQPRSGIDELYSAVERLERVLARAGSSIDDLVFVGMHADRASRGGDFVKALRSRSTTELPAIASTGSGAPFYGPSLTLCLDAVAVTG
ncbi:MAG TPA: RidA family protein [Rhodothermales bacterium]|nr:RidA family protein [Rhodothermales bacterium]